MQNYKEIRQLTITCSLEKTTHVPGDARTDVRFRSETPGGDILAGHAFPSLSFSWICPSIEANRLGRLFDFMLKNKAICLLFDFRKYSQNASKSTEATLKGI